MVREDTNQGVENCAKDTPIIPKLIPTIHHPIFVIILRPFRLLSKRVLLLERNADKKTKSAIIKIHDALSIL